VKDLARHMQDRPHWLADLWLRLIAGFKLFKGTLLVAGGVTAVGLLNVETARAIMRWVMDLAADRRYHVLDSLVVLLGNIDERTLRLLSVGSFLYAALFYTEGFGLFFDKRWAEYLTIVTTGGLIPFELFEIYQAATPIKLEVLIVNVAIVGYLVWRVGAKLDAEEGPAARVVS
jgi:uncharacterized membrane protein (DUF2068 family)